MMVLERHSRWADPHFRLKRHVVGLGVLLCGAVLTDAVRLLLRVQDRSPRAIVQWAFMFLALALPPVSTIRLMGRVKRFKAAHANLPDEVSLELIQAAALITGMGYVSVLAVFQAVFDLCVR